MAGYCDVPSTARAVAINVTVVAPSRFGFLAFWPADQPYPGTTNMHFNTAEAALANGALVPLSSDGAINIVYGTDGTPGTAHVIVDVSGYFPSDGAFQFVPLPPCRIVDTRNPNGPTGGPPLPGAGVRSFPIGGYCGVPSTARAASLNVTVVGPASSGHLILWPYNTPVPGTSLMNYSGGELAVFNGTIAALTPDPNFNVSATAYLSGGGSLNLLVDVTGYFR